MLKRVTLLLGVVTLFAMPYSAFAADAGKCPSAIRAPDRELKNSCEVTLTLNKVSVESNKCQAIWMRGALLNSSQAIPIQWDNAGFPLNEVKPGTWQAKVKLPEGETLQFKFTKSKSNNGNYVDEWEGGDEQWPEKANRSLQISCHSAKPKKSNRPSVDGAQTGNQYQAEWNVLGKSK